MSTTSREDYIKVIFNKSEESESAVTTKYISEKLSVSQAATSDMLKKLKSEDLVEYEKYRGVRLTEKGRKMALQVLRRHRLWELFLNKVLDMEWDEVHDEAEKLEHETSDKLINKIDEFLNFPTLDPHGAPIPDKNFDIPQTDKLIPLAEAKVGAKYTLMRVNDNDSSLITHLTQLGLLLESTFTVNDVRKFDASMEIDLSGTTHILSSQITQNLFVKEEAV